MSQVQKIFIQSIVTRCLKAIKSILIHEYQHKSTRVNTNQYESDTNQHESDTSQHKSETSQHESTQVKKCPRWVNMSQHKCDASLTQVNLSYLTFNL